MKTQIALLITLAFAYTAHAQSDYKITINGQPFDVRLDQSFTYITNSGERVEFVLDKKSERGKPDEQTAKSKSIAKNQKSYKDPLMEFDFPTEFGAVETEPLKEMKQITMLDGDGGGIIIQEFLSINPADLVDFLLQDIVGEQQMGSAQQVNQSISGKQLKGKFARDSGGQKVVVYSYGNGNQGVCITLIGDDRHREVFSKFLTDFKLKI